MGVIGFEPTTHDPKSCMIPFHHTPTVCWMGLEPITVSLRGSRSAKLSYQHVPTPLRYHARTISSRIYVSAMMAPINNFRQNPANLLYIFMYAPMRFLCRITYGFGLGGVEGEGGTRTHTPLAGPSHFKCAAASPTRLTSPKYRVPDLNQRPDACKAPALPTELTRHRGSGGS